MQNNALPDMTQNGCFARSFLPLAVLNARERMREQFRPVFRAHDITEVQWRILRILHSHAPIDATALADRADILAPSLTRMLRSLEHRNLIVMEKDSADQRRSSIRLSPRGHSFLEVLCRDCDKISLRIEIAFGASRSTALVAELKDLIMAIDLSD